MATCDQKATKYFRSTFTFEGKRYQRKGRTQKEADQKAALYRAQLEAGAVSASRMTVSEWWPRYLEIYHARASEKTRADYDSIYVHALAPYIGRLPLKSARSADLQLALNNLSTRSESYAKKAKFLLVGLFRAAVDNDLLPKSPAKDLRLPDGLPAGSRRALTPAERKIFREAAPTCKDGGLFLLIYHTGLRPSEAARVRFEDFDREARLLHVRGSKTKAATRTVPVPAAYEIPEGSGLLFRSQSGGELSENQRSWRWSLISKKMRELGEPAEDLTAYCLRHDYCTRLCEAGVPVEIAMKLMGHSSIAMTAEIYQHASENTLAIAARLIDAFEASG